MKNPDPNEVNVDEAVAEPRVAPRREDGHPIFDKVQRNLRKQELQKNWKFTPSTKRMEKWQKKISKKAGTSHRAAIHAMTNMDLRKERAEAKAKEAKK